MHTNTHNLNVGFIGLGAMGLNMARNLAAHGYLSAVYNRSLGKGNDLLVEHCATPALLAAKVDVIFICVSADRDVLEMVYAISEYVKLGTIVVDMSTVSSDTAQHAAEVLRSRQAYFLDAPVSGGVEGAKNARLVMMVGGDSDVLAKIRPILLTMCARIEHMGGHGAGQACKAVNQLMVAGINQAVTEALAFAAALELDLDNVIDIVAGGAAGNWFLQHRGKTMTQGLFNPGFKLALHYKDLLICQKMNQQSLITSRLLELTLTDYELLIQQGFGDEDISALFRLKRPQ